MILNSKFHFGGPSSDYLDMLANQLASSRDLSALAKQNIRTSLCAIDSRDPRTARDVVETHWREATVAAYVNWMTIRIPMARALEALIGVIAGVSCLNLRFRAGLLTAEERSEALMSPFNEVGLPVTGLHAHHALQPIIAFALHDFAENVHPEFGTRCDDLYE